MSEGLGVSNNFSDESSRQALPVPLSSAAVNDNSPYQPPLPQAPPALSPAMFGMPPVVKVMAILHLVFAGLGVITAAWGLLSAVVTNPLLKMTRSSPELDDHLNAQLAMQEEILPLTITSSILSLLVAIPMIIAGVQMLRKRRNGLKCSNVYAISSLGAKCVNLVLTFTIMVPAMERMTDGLMKGAPMPPSASGAMTGVMAGTAIAGVLVSCVYPVLTLILLNRPFVKSWFASQVR